MLQTKPKLKKCSVCKAEFHPQRMGQRVCGIGCAMKHGRDTTAQGLKKLEAAAKIARQAERKADRAKREAMKSLGELRAEAQTQFNRFIRLRDRIAGYGCICCGAPLDWDSGIPGGSVDAGHFVSRGSAIELAFDERNVNAQRKSCNRPGGTTRAAFRAGMIARYGPEVVDELEGPHELPHLKHDDFREIRDKYRSKANELAKQMEKETTAA